MSADIQSVPFETREETEKRARKFVDTIFNDTTENAEKCAENIQILAQKGHGERSALLDANAVQALVYLCSCDKEARTQAHGALALASLASNFATYEYGYSLGLLLLCRTAKVLPSFFQFLPAEIPKKVQFTYSKELKIPSASPTESQN